MKCVSEDVLINDFLEADNGDPWTTEEIIDFIRETESIGTCKTCLWNTKKWECIVHMRERTVPDGYCWHWEKKK